MCLAVQFALVIRLVSTVLPFLNLVITLYTIAFDISIDKTTNIAFDILYILYIAFDIQL